MNDHKKRGHVRRLTILDILALVAGIAGGASALDATKAVAEPHFAIRWGISLLLGFGCFWLMKLGFKSAITGLSSQNRKLHRTRLLGASCCIVAAIGLIAGAAFIAVWTLRLVVNAL